MKKKISKKNKIVIWLLSILFFFNLTDAAITYYVTANKLGKELNPLMKYLLEENIFLFFFLKILLCSLAIYLFWIQTQYNTKSNKVSIVIWICTGFYALNFIYQTVFLSLQFFLF